MVAKSLLLKGGAGLATAAAGGAGVYYGLDQHMNKLSAFDKGLINFLNGNEKRNDIIFEVKTGTGTNEDNASNTLTNDSFSTWSSTASTDPKWIVIKVSVSTDAKDKFKVKKTAEGSATAADDTDLKPLLDLNPTNDTNKKWDWVCVIKLSTSEASKTLKQEHKDAIYKATNEGLLGILTKDNSTENNSEIRDKKIKFIEKCGHNRGVAENKKRLGTDGKIKSSIEFKFVADENNLKPDAESEKGFKYWFDINQ